MLVLTLAESFAGVRGVRQKAAGGFVLTMDDMALLEKAENLEIT